MAWIHVAHIFESDSSALKVCPTLKSPRDLAYLDADEKVSSGDIGDMVTFDDPGG